MKKKELLSLRKLYATPCMMRAAAEDIPKTFIVCNGKKGMRVYLSQMASATLLRRAESEII